MRQTRFSQTEIFYTLQETDILVENWRFEYNTIRPHSSLGQRPPGPKTPTLIPALALPGGSRLY